MSKLPDPLLQYLPDLRVSRLGEEKPAGLLITSLPLPRNATSDLSLDGRATYRKALGQWAGSAAPSPRRLLMIADGGDLSPSHLALTKSTTYSSPTPSAKMRGIARNEGNLLFWENHALSIGWGGHSVELAMGLRTNGEVHWWQCCQLVVLEETPECLVVEMGGAIPHIEYGLEIFTQEGLNHANQFLHKHNWLNGHIYARLHANGVCEIFAHHINSKFYDSGLLLEDTVPVIGLRTDAGCSGLEEIAGSWDGSRTEIALGHVRFDMTSVANLATSEHPGNIKEERDFVVLQPYEGVDLYGGDCPLQLFGDEYLFHAEKHQFPRGMARTLRFSFSLSPDRSPNVVRYLAPEWWYGACEEFMPAPLLPVSNAYDELLENSREWLVEKIHLGGFEDGSVPRHTYTATRMEPGWEGEVPYAQFLSAWHTGNALEYDYALRSAYFIADVVVDHADNTFRMVGYPPPAIALPHARVQGSIAAYLEIGDPYLYDTAEAATEAAFRIHKNSWPRGATGRDVCFIRGAVLLYRYFNKEYFLEKAKNAISDVLASQMPDGSFGDQAGGTGIHQWAAYIAKPWMGCMACNPMLDYLELFPDEEEMLEGIKRFADWLMRERFEYNGAKGWGYQHLYAGGRDFVNYLTGEIQHDVLPNKTVFWHQEYLSRLLTYCSLRFNTPDYFSAWEESYQGTPKRRDFDHHFATTMQFIPWLQAYLWQARLGEHGVETNPVNLGDRTPLTAMIHTPDGPMNVKRKN